jgi:hypothetical protein
MVEHHFGLYKFSKMIWRAYEQMARQLPSMNTGRSRGRLKLANRSRGSQRGERRIMFFVRRIFRSNQQNSMGGRESGWVELY